MSAGTRLAAYWDWPAGAEVPDARIVVCAPGVMTDEARVLMWVEYERGRAFVIDVESDPPRGLHFYHGLNVRTQADLARLSAVLPMSVKRRALIVSPEEAITLSTAFRCGYCDGHGDVNENLCGSFVVCSDCGGAGTIAIVDVVFIVGTDKPMHPEWVRTIVEQCRKAGVPVILVTWGEWVPRGHLDPVWWVKEGDERRVLGGTDFRCVGTERSGALLDGEPVEDVPAWLDGGA